MISQFKVGKTLEHNYRRLYIYLLQLLPEWLGCLDTQVVSLLKYVAKQGNDIICFFLLFLKSFIIKI
jgi:hypothetical protein